MDHLPEFVTLVRREAKILPKTADQFIASAFQCRSVRLADGPTETVTAATTGPAPAVNGEPVDGEVLGLRSKQSEEQRRENQGRQYVNALPTGAPLTLVSENKNAKTKARAFVVISVLSRVKSPSRPTHRTTVELNNWRGNGLQSNSLRWNVNLPEAGLPIFDEVAFGDAAAGDNRAAWFSFCGTGQTKLSG